MNNMNYYYPAHKRRNPCLDENLSNQPSAKASFPNHGIV